MGADLSAEYDQRDAQFDQRYRERFGEDPDPEKLLEEYRVQKLKRDQEARYEELQRQRENERSKSDDEQYYRRKQDNNYKIMRESYHRNRDSGDYHSRRGESDRHRSHRSRRHRDDDYRRRRSSRRRDSSRERSRSAYSSDEKENRRSSRRRGSSKKSRSNSVSTADEHEHRSSRKSDKGSEKSKSRSKKDESRRSSKKTKEDTSSDDDKQKPKSRSSSKKKASEKNSTTEVEVKKKKKKKKKKRQAELAAYQSAPDLTAMDRQYGRGPWRRTHEYFDSYEQTPHSWIQELSRDRSGTFPTPVMERQIVYGLPTSPKAVDGLGYPLKENTPGFQPVPYQTYLMRNPTRHASMELYNGPASSGQPTVMMQQPPVSTTRIPAGAVPAVGSQTSPKVVDQSVKVVHQPVLNAAPKTATSQTAVPQKSYEVQAHLPAQRESALPSRFVRNASESTSIPPTYKTPPQYEASDTSHTPTPKPRNKSPNREIIIQKQKIRKVKASSPKRGPPKKTVPSKITATTAREDLEVLLASEYDMTRVKPHRDFSDEFPPVFPQTYRANQEIYVDDVVFRQHPKITELSTSESESSEMTTDEEHVLTLGEEFSPNSVGYSSGYDLEIPDGFKFDSSEIGSAQENTKRVKPKSAALLEYAKRQKKSQTSRRHAEEVQASKGTQTKTKTQQKTTKPRPLVLTSIEPVERPNRKSSSPDRKAMKKGQKIRNESPKRRSPQQQKHSKNAGARGRNAGSKSRVKSSSASPKRHSKTRKQPSPERQVETRIIYPTKASTHNEAPKTKKEKAKKADEHSKVSKRKNKRIQHPSKDDSYLRIITPSLNWVSKPAPKKTHDVGVGTKPSSPQKSVGIQTPKPKQPPAQPIYFLKPLSAHEVFIDDSTTNRSETDMSQPPASSVLSSDSVSKSGASWSKSSTYSSATEFTERSEVESVMQNFQRNSQLYSSNHRHDAPTVTSVDTNEPESEQHGPVGQASMTLGVSESIQASSYEGREGKVFCLTLSRTGSSPSGTLQREMKMRSEQLEHDVRAAARDQQIEPTIDTSILARHGGDSKEELGHTHANRSQDQDDMNFNPTEVGQWVLDCYVHDHKLTAAREQNWVGEHVTADHPPLPPPPADLDRMQNSHTTPMQAMPKLAPTRSKSPETAPPTAKLVPLTTESLAVHQGKGAPWGKRRVADSETDASLDIASDVGMFQKELIKTRHKMWKRQQKDDPGSEPVEQYKHRLKQWNNSPTTNVVLAECQAVTDLDSTLEGRGSPKHGTIVPQKKQYQPPQPPFSSSGYHSNSGPDRRSSSVSESEASSRSVSSAGVPGNVRNSQTPPHSREETQHAHKQDHRPTDRENAQKKSMQNIDKFLDDLDHDRASRARPAKPFQGGVPHVEDWRVVSPRGSVQQRNRPSSSVTKVDVNHNFNKMEETRGRGAPGQNTTWMRRSMDSLMAPTTVHKDKRASEDLQRYSNVRTASVTSDSASCSSPVANPFRKMDTEDIHSYVGNFPGRGSVEKIESEEKQLLKSLDARDTSRKETLEERTARILGIHRKILTSSSSNEDEDPRQKKENGGTQHSQEVGKQPEHKDLNTYMNNLLTGVTDVSPGTRKKYYAKEPAKYVLSPLATVKPQNHAPEAGNGQKAAAMHGAESGKQREAQDEPDSAGSDTATVTESFSVNVSDSVLEASIDCKVMQDGRKDHGAPQAPPTEYKIPENVTPQKHGMTSPKPQGSMLTSYTMNIYADTPGFHKAQRSIDTTESEGDTDLDASFNMTMNNKMVPSSQNGVLHKPRIQESPVPIASNSAPLTKREIEIVRELYDQNTSSGRSSSSADSSEERKPPPASMPPSHRRLSHQARQSVRPASSRSPSRELAKDKIAKSIGFKLHTSSTSPALSSDHSSRRSSSDGREEHLVELADYEEYDIKILSADRRNSSRAGTPDSRTRQSLQQVGKSHRVMGDDEWTNKIQPSRQQSLRNVGNALAEPNHYVHESSQEVKNAMESVGLDPTDAWLMSV